MSTDGAGSKQVEGIGGDPPLFPQPHSNNYELSENAIKMTFFLISGQKIIMKGCARRNSQVASTSSQQLWAITASLTP